jgi:hypothetical protein
MNRIARTAGWGVFCACSWTWCIGMFLPAIMLHRFGWPGFLVFAIPNVLGCVGLGYVVRSREQSQRILTEHAAAVRWFSVVTIAFQLFFAAFVVFAIQPGSGSIPAALAAVAGLLAAGTLVSFLPERWWPALAVVVYAVSLTAFAVIGTAPLNVIEWKGAHPPRELVFLAPVIIFGFALCPYLDATFHRAFQRSPSRHAFGVFGVTFAIMIVLTCAVWTAGEPVAGPLVRLAVAHIVAQLVFTVGAHARELRERSPADARPRALAVSLAIAALGALAVLGIPMGLPGESIYLRFMVFYGLVFPLWVLLFVGPGRRLPRDGRGLAAFAVLAVLFMPLYELGFIHRQAGWLLLPTAVYALIVVWRARQIALPLSLGQS